MTTIAVVTDSNSQIPPSLVDRFRVTVVPLSVTVDGVTYSEGVDLDADRFWERFDGGAAPTVSTAQPGPGQFAAAYDRAVAEGADAILSVHIGSAISGTVNSARLGSSEVAVPVRIVDTGTASFAVALSVWAAAEAVRDGAGLDGAAAVAESTAAATGNVFVVKALDLARAGGRLAAGEHVAAAAAVPVLTMAGGTMTVIGQAADLDEAAAAMVAHVEAAGGWSRRVGVGLGDRAMLALVEALESRLGALSNVAEVVRYRVGPSVGAHTGPGTVGVMYG